MPILWPSILISKKEKVRKINYSSTRSRSDGIPAYKPFLSPSLLSPHGLFSACRPSRSLPFKIPPHLFDDLPHPNQLYIMEHPAPAQAQAQAQQPYVDDLSDDLQSMSFSSSTDITSSSSDTITTTTTYTSTRAHTSDDACWDAIRRSKSETGGALGMSDLRFLQRLGSGDIGSVYLAELKCAEGYMFAAKVMNKKELAGRNKEGRARTEREILDMLDHPFLPTLYAAMENGKWSCLLTEFCTGGDLHVLRQRQPGKRFDESAVRFYASEIIVALEYVHMMGIVYRDLKPENVLVRADGHIMLTDFDLSLKCDNAASTAQIVTNRIPMPSNTCNDYSTDPPPFASTSCILPNCIVPAVSCFHPKRKRKKKPGCNRGVPEFVSEPVDVRSMSFVGTHEYLAPEIVSGEGHGSAVDWWTLGIFVFELLYGVTPFKGGDNEMTLANIVARALEFPKDPPVGGPIKDLIAGLLVKDPARRMGSTMGAAAIKHHPFFQGVNWALLRCTPPPYIPPPFTCRDVSDDSCPDTPVEYY